jgi:hypothetical protein
MTNTDLDLVILGVFGVMVIGSMSVVIYSLLARITKLTEAVIARNLTDLKNGDVVDANIQLTKNAIKASAFRNKDTGPKTPDGFERVNGELIKKDDLVD